MQQLHIHQERPICRLTGEKHSFSAKPAQANLTSYLGTKQILSSSAELQLQPLKSTAQTANCPYFTTASVQLSAQAPATFSAVVKWFAALSCPCHSSPALQPLDKDEGLHTTSPSRLCLFLLCFNAQLKIAFSLFLNSFTAVW